MTRLYHAIIGLLAAVTLAFWLLQLTYPALPAMVLLLTGAMLMWYRPSAWLVLVPALWPIIDLVPSTGRMYFTESDALAALCIGMLGLKAVGRPATAAACSRPSGPGLAFLLLLAGIALSYLVSSINALLPLPALDENAFVGYSSPFNALRLSKGLLWALLLLPHWLTLRRQDGTAADALLRIGMTAGLATASLAALWDRAAFTALFDFASDYRTTALFWEMHVGGAALDGWLMLTLPFAVAGLLGGRRPLAIAVHLAVLALAAYAILTTFSRGVYLGCAVMLLVALPAWWRHRRKHHEAATAAGTGTNPWIAPLLFTLLAMAAVPVFHGGGYRGLAALFAASSVVFVAGGLLRPMRPGTWLLLLCAAGPLAAMSYLLHDQFPKAAYWLFGTALVGSLASSYLVWKKPSVRSRGLLAIFATWCAGGTGWICWHWGGDAALPGGLIASGLLCLALVAQTVLPRAIWALGRHQATTAMISSLAALMIAVGAGSYFIGERFSTVGQDFHGRLQHWRQSKALIHSDREWVLGIGVGRYGERYRWHAPTSEMPGAWRIASNETGEHESSDNAFLQLVGPRYPMSFNQLLRVSQRIGLNLTGPFSVKLRARAPEPVSLSLEVCQKHLLYPGDCAWGHIAVPGGNKWSEIHQPLPDKPLSNGGRWTVPTIINFSVATETQGKSVDIDDIDLRDAHGDSLLENGDFAHGADHWFFSSDRVHLPYHAKNMYLHLLVEQGLFGTLVVALACLTAVWQLGLGRASREKAAPALLAALTGFLTVGLFDSLLDVPRDGVFFFLLLGIALAMQTERLRAAPQVLRVQFSEHVGADDTAVARGTAPAKRLWLGIAILLGLPSVALWVTYIQVGRTPGELMDHIEKQLRGWPRTKAIALPGIITIRNLLDAPSLEDRRKRKFIVPPPPPLVVTKGGGRPEDSFGQEAAGRVLQVGRTAPIRTIAEAARLARDGDIVEIQAGEYHADVALWHQKKLTIRGVGGNARIFADGKSAEDKAIWVIRNGDFEIANIDFIGARVSDRNGAGIRFENGRLRIRNCLFWGNESGVLSTGGKDQKDASIEIENSEFAYNGAGDGQSHHLYVGTMGSLKVKGSYFHHANAGHLIKSRAAINEIAYNRLTNESGGRASYELEFPNGGVAHVIGNIIQQDRETENSTLISYGTEQYIWPNNRLYLSSNTLINDHPNGGAFLRVEPGAARVVSTNNLLIGRGRYHVPDNLESINDIDAGWEIFSQASRHDYRLNDAGRKFSYQPIRPDSAEGNNPNPQYQYMHPRQVKALAGNPAYPGAIQTTDR